MRSSTEALAIDRVFHVHSVSKVYHMGEVEVRALRSVELELLEGESLGPRQTPVFCYATVAYAYPD